MYVYDIVSWFCVFVYASFKNRIGFYGCVCYFVLFYRTFMFFYHSAEGLGSIIRTFQSFQFNMVIAIYIVLVSRNGGGF
jgi:hypothetical protein